MTAVKGRSGGARSGAGRKPTSARVLRLHGSRRAPAEAFEAPAVDPLPELEAPAALSAEERAVWDVLAPLARAAGTLTAAMVPAFARLCRLIVRAERWERTIAADGETCTRVTVDGGRESSELKAHPLIARAQVLEASIRGAMKDFAINPFGKPVTSAAAPAVPVDPFAEFEAGPAAGSRGPRLP
jgi:terminase small subunit-like protein